MSFEDLKWYDLHYRGVSYPNYEINEIGMVRNKKTGRILQKKMADKYGQSEFYVTISHDGKSKQVYVLEAGFLSRMIHDNILKEGDGVREDKQRILPY